jgi:hypothetical protein
MGLVSYLCDAARVGGIRRFDSGTDPFGDSGFRLLNKGMNMNATNLKDRVVILDVTIRRPGKTRRARSAKVETSTAEQRRFKTDK